MTSVNSEFKNSVHVTSVSVDQAPLPLFLQFVMTLDNKRKLALTLSQSQVSQTPLFPGHIWGCRVSPPYGVT